MLAPIVKHIHAYEPIAIKNAMTELVEIKNISYVESSLDAIKNSHFLVIATEYSQFWNMSPEHFMQLKDKCIFDGRNILDKDKIESMGIQYFGVGR